MSGNKYEITGDSGEYEFLTEAVAVSAGIAGMCIEIGVRRGFGTKTIIDAVAAHCPQKVVLGVDPYGSIPYVGREHIGPIRLDYDNPMRNVAMQSLFDYSHSVGINWIPFIMTDTQFFKTQFDGVEINDIETSICNKYSMAHLDGPHNYEHVSQEILWFNDRMDVGATIVIDDCTPDFIDIEPVNKLLYSLGWEMYRQGVKKNIYIKETLNA